eukprot:m.185416 g.185416  ORF g.185416 m.185416 type:complete len:847 (-) comp13605_c1_seq6:193-2733(-)
MRMIQRMEKRMQRKQRALERQSKSSRTKVDDVTLNLEQIISSDNETPAQRQKFEEVIESLSSNAMNEIKPADVTELARTIRPKCLSTLAAAFDPRPGQHNESTVGELDVSRTVEALPRLGDDEKEDDDEDADEREHQSKDHQSSGRQQKGKGRKHSSQSKRSRQSKKSKRKQKAEPKEESLVFFIIKDMNKPKDELLCDDNLYKIENSSTPLFGNALRHCFKEDQTESSLPTSIGIAYAYTSEVNCGSMTERKNKPKPKKSSSPNSSALGEKISQALLEVQNTGGVADDALSLLQILFNLMVEQTSGVDMTNRTHFDDCLLSPSLKKLEGSVFALSAPFFKSEKITHRLEKQMEDGIVLASYAIPSWCDKVMQQCPVLFPFESRRTFFFATAFGPLRTVIWVQNRRDELVRSGGRAAANVVNADRSIGRLRSEKVVIDRSSDDFFATASKVLRLHATHKTTLEVEFAGEAGTGLGPTLEFYSLVCAHLQRKDLGLWLCDDDISSKDVKFEKLDLGSGEKPAGYYVRRSHGLFPAPYPQDSVPSEVVSNFELIGVFVAKAMQDKRLVDLHFSLPLLKILREQELSFHDLALIHPHMHKTLKAVHDLSLRKTMLETEFEGEELTEALDGLLLSFGSGTDQCQLDDLCLSMVYTPPSSVYGFKHHPLIDGGEDIDVTVHNAGEFVQRLTSWMIKDGIAKQTRALRRGFYSVFPMNKLSIFAPNEILLVLGGEQDLNWTIEELLAATEPQHGYTREDTAYVQFLEILRDMSTKEKKAFLLFATGSPAIPPGGMRNLSPHLTIVRKQNSSDSVYPSVNTCMHYLKLPVYSSKEIMKEKLLVAISTKGFLLN